MSYVVFCLKKKIMFLMIRQPPRSTLDRSSAASDVYKRQPSVSPENTYILDNGQRGCLCIGAVFYTHLIAHETPEHVVCRLLLEKKNYVFNDTATTEIYTRSLVGSVRCV